jgi:hypothetical protein
MKTSMDKALPDFADPLVRRAAMCAVTPGVTR